MDVFFTDELPKAEPRGTPGASGGSMASCGIGVSEESVGEYRDPLTTKRTER